MRTASNSWGIVAVTLFLLTIATTATAKYSGGTGEPNDPYQIATAADLIALGETPEDYDKHFILTDDIDLDPNLPSGKVFDKAVIAPDTDPNDQYSEFQGTPFTGVFDGNAHKVLHLSIMGKDYLGLFGRLESGAEVRGLGVVDGNVVGSGDCVGGLVGYNDLGTVTQCYSTGAVSGAFDVGGLVGSNNFGGVTDCHSSATVSGSRSQVGGLVGNNDGWITQCYSTGAVSGSSSISIVGGLVGWNARDVTQCYSTGAVSGKDPVGGLVGYSDAHGVVLACFWDTQTSGRSTSAGGTGVTTAQMRDPTTFMGAGWDFVGQPDGPHDIWSDPEGGGYPILYWQLPDGFGLPRFSGGTGEPNDPYMISKPEQVNAIGHNPRLMNCHFKLASDLDLAGLPSYPIGASDHSYTGVFDGNGKTIRNLSHSLFGIMRGVLRDLDLVDPNCDGSPVESNWGTVTCCSVQGGKVLGSGGLVAGNSGTVTLCYSTTTVSSEGSAGGLVGVNLNGTVTQCYSAGEVSGANGVGGLVGSNGARGAWPAEWFSWGGVVTDCYSTAEVRGTGCVGGLVGWNIEGYPEGIITHSFWDTQTSGQATSAGGTSKTTVEMQMASTFIDVGWDFVGETANGTEDLWWILEGKDYPRLWWEAR